MRGTALAVRPTAVHGRHHDQTRAQAPSATGSRLYQRETRVSGAEGAERGGEWGVGVGRDEPGVRCRREAFSKGLGGFEGVPVPAFSGIAVVEWRARVRAL